MQNNFETISRIISTTAAETKSGDDHKINDTAVPAHPLLARIAELEASLVEKDTMFREFNHRVKNNLQLVSSLLSLQAAKLDNQEHRKSLEEALERIQAIAVVHQLLDERTQTITTNLPNYLDALCRRIARAYLPADRITFAIHADPINISVDNAIRLALLVNEVVTNAAKYAFPGERKGQITVALRRQNELCRLMVADDGVGARRRGGRKRHFGMELIEVFTAYFGGEITFETGSFGTIFTLSMPISAIEISAVEKCRELAPSAAYHAAFALTNAAKN